MTDSGPYSPTSEIPDAEPPGIDFSIPKAVVLLLTVPLAIGSVAAAHDLFLFTFYNDTVTFRSHKSNTPFLVAYLTSPLVLLVAVVSAIFRPRFRLRTWLIVISTWLTPAALMLLSFPIIDHYMEYEIYISPGAGKPGKTIRRKAGKVYVTPAPASRFGTAGSQTAGAVRVTNTLQETDNSPRIGSD